MQLKIQRSQRVGGLLGNKIIFGLGVRAEYTAQERADIAKYRMSDHTVLAPALDLPPESNIKVGGIITIDGLAKGCSMECQSIGDLLIAEDKIKEACKGVQAYLHVAESFDGREILLDLDEPGAATA